MSVYAQIRIQLLVDEARLLCSKLHQSPNALGIQGKDLEKLKKDFQLFHDQLESLLYEDLLFNTDHLLEEMAKKDHNSKKRSIQFLKDCVKLEDAETKISILEETVKNLEQTLTTSKFLVKGTKSQKLRRRRVRK